MSQLADSPAFIAYAIATVVLSLNWIVLWSLSGLYRVRTKTTPNPEDAGMLRAEVATQDPPAVARALRAHRNTADNTTPFLFLGLVYVLLGGETRTAELLFAAFTTARVLYTVTYLLGLQPWRSLAYTVGGVSTLALVGAVISRLLACGCG